MAAWAVASVVAVVVPAVVPTTADDGVEATLASPPIPAVPLLAAVAPDPALVRFVVWPWAEVRIEGQDSFLTPRAEPVSLGPGTHRIVFVHPTYGRAEYTLELAAGEQRQLRHVFEAAPAP